MVISEYVIKGCMVKKLNDRYLYCFLSYLSGNTNRIVITIEELSRRTGISRASIFHGLSRLEKKGLILKSYVYFRLNSGELSRKLKLEVVKEPPIQISERFLFLKTLSPSEKGMLLSLINVSNPERKIFMTQKEIAEEIFCTHPNTPSFKKTFKALMKKGILKKERFCYVIQLPEFLQVP
ncbi:MAG TPA: MarR family transcriptional regulator [Aquificaceae bacterium]|nr:MarR family transcriptional regulator [Aquificaceae bacterium]